MRPKSTKIMKRFIKFDWNGTKKFFSHASRSLLCIRFVVVVCRSEEEYIEEDSPPPPLDGSGRKQQHLKGTMITLFLPSFIKTHTAVLEKNLKMLKSVCTDGPKTDRQMTDGQTTKDEL